MFKNVVIGTIAALCLAATAGHAATLNFYGSGQTYQVSNNDIDAAFNTELDIISGDQKTYRNGLYLDVADGAAEITYTYIGYEAGNRNFAAVVDGGVFLNRGTGAATIGQQVTTHQDTSGLLQFAFGTVAPRDAMGLFLNNALAYPASSNFAVGFSQINANSYYALFDDIANGDRDFDDMVMRIDVAAVPLPAGILMLLTALLGLGAMRRYQTTA